MAFGSLSSLGFGSGVLTQDTIDKLKEAEQKARIDPYTKKIEENTTKQKDLTEIKTKLLSFQTAVSSLADATVFAKRKVVGSISDNPPASLTVNSGVALQSMNINVTQLAQKDVYQSKGLANDGGFVNAQLNGTADLTFFSNGKEYTVTVDKNTTYRDLADKINEASGGEIVAKIVNTGEKGTPYRLTLTSKETGEDSAISFYAGKKDSSGKYTSDSNAETIFKNLGWELDTTSSIDPAKDKKGYGIKDASLHIQTAQNAEFTLDGIKMFRSSNTVTDLGVGMTLTLNKTGEINFDVQQDFEGVTKAMQDLVDAYNDLVTNLNAATDYNSETGTKGTLQGISEVNSIRSSILADLFDSQVVDGTTEDANGNKVNTKVMLSMQDFGLSLNDAGTLSFNSSKFEQKVKEDPDSTESFFSNITKYEDINHTGEVIKTGSLSKYLTNGLEFKPG
ncbi:flagellar filament capping protein FliD, partial [Campylobacter coli]|nr:flagellar filament capping protein FliD [Campylobacter coli]